MTQNATIYNLSGTNITCIYLTHGNNIHTVKIEEIQHLVVIKASNAEIFAELNGKKYSKKFNFSVKSSDSYIIMREDFAGETNIHGKKIKLNKVKPQSIRKLAMESSGDSSSGKDGTLIFLIIIVIIFVVGSIICVIVFVAQWYGDKITDEKYEKLLARDEALYSQQARYEYVPPIARKPTTVVPEIIPEEYQITI
jgi:hypothetical protein